MKIVEKMILQYVIRPPLTDTSNYFSAFKLSAVPERAYSLSTLSEIFIYLFLQFRKNTTNKTRTYYSKVHDVKIANTTFTQPK